MPSLNTGNAILSNAIAVDSSYNVGIGGAASGSFKLDVNGSVNLAGNVTTTGAQYVQNGFYLANANAGATAFYTNMWGADDGVQFALRNLTGGARFIFQSATSYNYTFPAATGTIALTSNIPTVSGTSGYFAKFTGSSAVGNSSFVTETGTGVGFQIASPLSLLHMNGQSGTAGLPSLLLYGEAPSNGQRYGFNVSADQLDISALGASASIGFYTGGNASSITRRLLISSTGAATFSSSVAANGVMSLGNDGTYGSTYKTLGLTGNSNGSHRIFAGTADNLYIAAATARGINFWTDGSSAPRMIITSGGNIGIGTDVPLKNVHIARGGNVNGILFTDDSAGNYRNEINNTFNGSTAASNLMTFLVSNATTTGQTTVMTLNGGGSVCINATSPGSNSPYLYNFNGDGSRFNAAFEVGVATPGFTSIAFRNPNGTVGSIAINTSTVTYGGTSDYRLKEDLKDFNGLDKVNAIKVYDFKWKASEERNEGVLAHELMSVIPYAVNGEKDDINEDGSIKSQMVDYSKLVPVLIKSIQELNQKVNDQQQTINSLINR